MRWLTLVLVLMFAGLQWRVWLGDASVGAVQAKQARLHVLEAERDRLERRNDVLAAEVVSLRQGVDAVEAQARLSLGFVRHDEHFYQVIEAVRPDTITPSLLNAPPTPRFLPDD